MSPRRPDPRERPRRAPAPSPAGPVSFGPLDRVNGVERVVEGKRLVARQTEARWLVAESDPPVIVAASRWFDARELARMFVGGDAEVAPWKPNGSMPPRVVLLARVGGEVVAETIDLPGTAAGPKGGA